MVDHFWVTNVLNIGWTCIWNQIDIGLRVSLVPVPIDHLRVLSMMLQHADLSIAIAPFLEVISLFLLFV
jgi:hypothetical protein